MKTEDKFGNVTRCSDARRERRNTFLIKVGT